MRSPLRRRKKPPASVCFFSGPLHIIHPAMRFHMHRVWFEQRYDAHGAHGLWQLFCCHRRARWCIPSSSTSGCGLCPPAFPFMYLKAVCPCTRARPDVQHVEWGLASRRYVPNRRVLLCAAAPFHILLCSSDFVVLFWWLRRRLVLIVEARSPESACLVPVERCVASYHLWCAFGQKDLLSVTLCRQCLSNSVFQTMCKEYT